MWHKRVTLVLVAVPSRMKVADYAMLKRQLDEQVGRIVGRFSSDGWMPLRYLYTQFVLRNSYPTTAPPISPCLLRCVMG